MAYAGKYLTEIKAAASKYGVDPNLIAAVIYAESNFNPGAGSGAGAKGLMQLMPGTFKEYGKGNILNPQDNINAGTNYLSKQLKAFGKVDLALAAYNAGPGAVKKYNGIPPFKETQNYVIKVTAKYKEYGGSTIVEGVAATPGIKTGNNAIDGLLKTPVLWVALLVAFLIK
jgi:soluble lytic murein transglycosylase-like protein